MSLVWKIRLDSFNIHKLTESREANQKCIVHAARILKDFASLSIPKLCFLTRAVWLDSLSLCRTNGDKLYIAGGKCFV